MVALHLRRTSDEGHKVGRLQMDDRSQRESDRNQTEVCSVQHDSTQDRSMEASAKQLNKNSRMLSFDACVLIEHVEDCL